MLGTATVIWYLPHHSVINENNPGKVYRLSDASIVFLGKSLSSNLLSGPDLLNNFTGVMHRFRENSAALSAVMGAMFVQVKVDPKIRAFLRYLWYDKGKN